MRSDDRREARRVRRGRQPGSQQGQGHGKPLYVPRARTNRMVSEEELAARRVELAERAARALEHREALREKQRKAALDA